MKRLKKDDTVVSSYFLTIHSVQHGIRWFEKKIVSLHLKNNIASMTSLLFSFAPTQLWLQALLLVVGIVVVLRSADFLTEGAVAMASRLHIPQIVIGLTIVAMGTSMPEFCVSLFSALKGTADLAVGNVVGSNIFNTMLIVGCAAIIAPIAIAPSTIRNDVPYAIIASFLLFQFTRDGEIRRWEAGVMLALFVYFLWNTVKKALKERNSDDKSNKKDSSTADAPQKEIKMARASLMVIAGLVGLVLGSSVFVDNASAVAHSLGVSDAIIGLTIVAGGTSLPELATSIVAARRGNSGIAIGNVLGSNVFNILMILGVTGIISPMQIKGITSFDIELTLYSLIALWLFAYTRLKIERWEGALLASAYVAYLTYLIQGVI